MSTLQAGGILRSRRDLTLKVGKLLGTGSQGEVYRVVATDGQEYALKWYHAQQVSNVESCEEQRGAFLGSSGEGFGLAGREPPDPRFLWPLDYVELETEEVEGRHLVGYGYVRRLLPEGYVPFEDLVLGKVRFPTDRGGPLRTICTAAIGLADCFRVLHLMGLCFRDVHFRGFFFNPGTGDTLTYEFDNICNEGEPSTVFFTELAAPEVNAGESRCSIVNDEHSLAVLLFYVFCRGNPLEGSREVGTYVFEENAKLRAYGKKPIFVFDPDDDTNRPLPEVQNHVTANWNRLPSFIREAFTQVFTEGLRVPKRRVNDTQWVQALSRLRDSIYVCAKCGKEGFYEVDRNASQQRHVRCPLCGYENVRPPRLEINGRTPVVLCPTTQLYPHHVGKLHDFSQPIAEMAPHPTKPGLWGLKNRSDRNWMFTDVDGATKDIAPDRSVILQNERVIDFGGVKGQIRF